MKRSEDKTESPLDHFIEIFCKSCSKRCEIPSVQMFSCVFEKLAKQSEEDVRKRRYKKHDQE
jgi:hypothetical protein